MAAKHKGLGKGLGTLLGEVADINRPKESAPASEENKTREETVRIRLIEPNREQPRKDFDEESLQELAESIRTHGVIQPLLVMKNGERYRIIAGERRWRAAKLAGLKEVPVIVKDYSEEEIAEIALIENLQRNDLNPIEEASAYQKLMEDFHLTQEALSERIAINRSVIANALRLLKLPEDLRDQVAAGTISTGHAKVLLGLEDPERMRELAARIREENLSVRDLEAVIHAMGRKKRTKTVFRNQEEYDNTARGLEEKLGTHVRFSRKNEHSGKIEIDYSSLEDLERILSHIR